MKKVIHYLRWKLAQWHKKRFQKLMAKCMGATRYYSFVKNNLNSIYGLQVNEYESFKKAWESGETHADRSSLYPNIFMEHDYPNIYADSDSVK